MRLQFDCESGDMGHLKQRLVESVPAGAGVMSSWLVSVIGAAAPMSFHSSFHFKALNTLAQCDEGWISLLPLLRSDQAPASETTHVLPV